MCNFVEMQNLPFRKPVKVNWRYDEDGNKVRVSERTGRIIPISVMEEETYDYKLKKAYVGKKLAC